MNAIFRRYMKNSSDETKNTDLLLFPSSQFERRGERK